MTVASINIRNTLVGKEAAIALACVSTTDKIILSDSKAAVQNFCKGVVCSQTDKLLRRYPSSREVSLIWVPAHEGIPANEAAHSLAR